MDDFSEVCTDISVTSNVIKLCQGKQKCSFLVDLEQFPLLSNNDSSSREISCHKNYSVLKTTAACVDERILDMQLVSSLTEETEEKSLITSTMEQLQSSNGPEIPVINDSSPMLVNEAKLLNSGQPLIKFEPNEVETNDVNNDQVSWS